MLTDINKQIIQDDGGAPLTTIVAHYYISLERLARRIVSDKSRAPDVVKWAMEAVHEQHKFHDGPQLRALLIEKTITMALGYNRALVIYNQMELFKQDKMI